MLMMLPLRWRNITAAAAEAPWDEACLVDWYVRHAPRPPPPRGFTHLVEAHVNKARWVAPPDHGERGD